MTNQDDFESESKGDSVMEQVGAVKAAAKALNDSVDESKDEQEEVSGWITLIGKALLSIFK